MTDQRIKLLIVDDEYLVRELLKRCVDWHALGIDIIGEASDAREGMEIVEQQVPDMIFTDIYMPFVDGIAFSKMVIERYPHIKIIVLTGHEEFEYAKRSIKVGIADFLLKPINDDVIKKVVLNMKEKILKERHHNKEHQELKKKLEENLPYLRERFLNGLIANMYPLEDIEERLQYYQLHFQEDYIQIGIIDIVPGSAHDISEENTLLLTMEGLQQIKKFFKKDQGVYVWLSQENHIIILSSKRQVDLLEQGELIKTMLLNKLKSYITVGISKAYQQVMQIRTAYQEAITALRYKVVVGKNEVIHYKDIHFSNDTQPSFNTELVSTYTFNLKAGLTTETHRCIDDFFRPLLDGYGTLANLSIFGINVLTHTLNTVSELGIDIQEDYFDAYTTIVTIDNLPDIQQYLKELTNHVIEQIHQLKHSKIRSTMEEVRAYMETNSHCEDISLASVAKVFYMNPSYLSRTFKKEMGQSFIEYLTRIRMEKAICLIKTTNLKAYEIADQIGFVDPHYFSICFKKYTGMPVSKFKKYK